MNGKVRATILLVGILCLVASSALASDFFGTDYDFGGRTVTFWHWSMDELAGRFGEGEVAQGRVEEAERLFNVKIQFEVAGWNVVPEVYMARLLSGDSPLDVWGVSQGIAFFDLVKEGALLPMTDIVPPEYYDTISYELRTELEMLSYNGEIYGIGPSTHSAKYSPSIVVSVYNKDMFEREGLEDPYELYLAGEWTWDKVTELAKKLTKDTDNDGVIDQWGMTDIWPHAAPSLMISNGGNVIRLDEDGRMIYCMDERPALEALQQIYEWDQVHKVMQGSDSDFIAGKVGLLMLQSIHGVIPIKNQMEENYGLVPNPRGPRMDEHTYPKFAMATFVLPANSEMPEALVALTNFLYREDDVDEDDYVDAFVRDRNSARVLLEANAGWRGETFLVRSNEVRGLVEPAMNAVKDGEKSPAVAAGEVRPAVQNLLDEMFNK
mgnify:CR=1 FL=1